MRTCSKISTPELPFLRPKLRRAISSTCFGYNKHYKLFSPKSVICVIVLLLLILCGFCFGIFFFKSHGHNKSSDNKAQLKINNDSLGSLGTAWDVNQNSSKSQRPPSTRILKGNDSTPGEFPYLISLQAFNQDEDRWVHICGGMILNPTTILSAAHCALYNRISSDEIPTTFRIIAGEYNLYERDGTEQIRIVASYALHPEWSAFNKRNDIGLYFLGIPLDFTESVQPAKLPPKDHIAQGDAKVVGWGSNSEDGPILSILQKVEIPIFPSDLCKAGYGDDFYSPEMICAGDIEGHRDACTGDSGGPLIANDLGYDYIAGLTSWGIGCGRFGYLGFYTNVSIFTSWIKSMISSYQNLNQQQMKRRY